MALTFRDIKGAPLTHEEVDANFRSYFTTGSYQAGQFTLIKPNGESITIPVGNEAFTQFIAEGGSISGVHISGSLITGSDMVVDFLSSSIYRKDYGPGSTFGVQSRELSEEYYISFLPDETYYPYFVHLGPNLSISSSGHLIASGARLEGDITASAGLIGGFEIKNDVLTSRPGGAFESSIFISGSPSLSGTFIGTSNFTVQGSGDITGSAVLFTGGKIAGWTINSDSIYKDDVVLNATDGTITLGSASFASPGIQLDYNSGTPRFYAGDGTANFIKYDGTNVEIETGKFELDATNIEISSLHASMSLGEGNIVMYGDISRIDIGSANKVVIQGGATDNFIRMGSKTDFNQFSTAGIIMGMNNTVPTLDLTKDASNYVRFDSTNGVDIKTNVFSLDTDYIDIDSSTQRVQIYNTASAEIIRMGEISDDASDLYGLKIYDGIGTTTDNAIAMFGQQGNKIAGWEVTNTQLRSIPDAGFGGQYAEGETGLVLHSSGRIESSDFVSGLKGWRVDTLGNGSAEFENVRVRGTLRTTVFEKESVNVVGGQLMVSNGTTIQALRSGSAVIAGSTYVAATDTTMSVANVSGFARGEILMAKKVNSTGFSVEYIYVTGSKRFSEDPSLAYITGSSGTGSVPIDPDGLAGELYVGRAYGQLGPSSISSSISVLSADIPMITDGVGETGSLSIDNTGSLLIQDVIKIGDERMKITGITGTGTAASASLTVIRDFGDTQPAPHNAGDVVYKVDLDREFLAGLVSTAEDYYEGQVLVSTGKYSVGTSFNDKFPYQYNVSGTPSNNGEYRLLSGSTHITTNITGSTSLEIYYTDANGTDRGPFFSLFDKGSYIIPLIDGTNEWVRFRVSGNPSINGNVHTFPITLNQDFYQAQSPATDTTNSAIDIWFMSNIQDVSSGYILANANPNDLYTPYIDIVERTGSGVYDLSLKTRLGDLSGLASPYLYGDEEPGFGIYTENGFFRGTITAMTGSIAGILHVATEQGGIETGQKVSIGRGVQGSNDGIHINNNNYWYTDAAFKVGGQNNYVTLDNSVNGNLQIRVQDFGLETDNMIISSSFDNGSIRMGVTATDITETANTGIYVNGDGKFRVGTGTGVASPQYVHWDGSTLTVSGDINVIGGNAATTTNVADAITSGSLSAEAARVAAVATGSISASNAYSESVNYASSSVASISGSFVDTIQTVDSKIFTNDRGRVVLPPTASTDGLYLGSTNLGFYGDGVWKTYMANNGNFYLTGSTGGYLTWNSITGELDVKGTVRATAGDIGGVQLTDKSTYVGAGDYNSGSTAYYLSASGDFSLGDKLVWDASAGSLTIAGDITVEGGDAVTSTELELAKAEASASAIFSASVDLNASSSALADSISQTALTASAEASSAQSAAESTALGYVSSSITSLQSFSSASVATLSSSLGAMAAIDEINSGNNTTYIGNDAIVTDLIASNALISTNYNAPDSGEIYSDAGMFLDFKNGNILSPSFVVNGSNAYFKGTVTVGATNLTEANTINTTDVLEAGAVNHNPDLTKVGADGRPSGIKAVYGSGVTSNISYNDTAQTQLKIYNSSDTSIGAGWPAFKLNTDARYLISIRVKASANISSGFYFRVQELDSELPEGITHICNEATVSETGVVEDTRQISSGFKKASDGTELDLDNIALTTTFVEYTFYYTPTSTAKYASPIILNWTGAGTNAIIVDRVHIAPETLVKARGTVGGWTIDSNAIYRGTELADDTYATANGQITLGAGFIGAKQFKINSSGNAYFKGAITGGTLDIGGSDATSFHVDSSGNIWSGNAAFASAPFKVSNAGALTATGATISGALTATSGEIGGWKINSTSIYTGTEDHSGYTANAGDITIYSNGTDSSLHSSQFYIDTSGNAKFKGAIEGGTLDIGGSDSTSFHVDSTGNIWSGADTYANAASKFRVSNTGVLNATGATISGAITLTSGTTYDLLQIVSGSVNSLDSQVSGLVTDVATNSENIFTNVSGSIVKAPIPNGAGLYLGQNHLGYYSSGWKTFMSSSGAFYLAGSGNNGLGWDGTSLTLDGTINARDGYIGNGTSGFNIGNTAIYNAKNTLTSATAGVYIGTDGIGLGAGSVFKVTSAGALTASSATISGTVTATGGSVGGWTIHSDKIFTGTDENVAGYTSTAGRLIISSSGAIHAKEFYVSKDGNAYFKGSIQGGTLDIGGSDSTSFHVDSTGNIWSGASTYAAGTFKVSNTGVLNATGATISGNITATSGTFTGTITSTSTISGATISGATITGGTINIGNGDFQVDSSGNTTVDGYLYVDDTGIILLGSNDWANTPPKTWLNKNGIRVLTYDVNGGTEDVTGGDMRWYANTTTPFWDARLQSFNWDSATTTGWRDGSDRQALLMQAHSFLFKSLTTTTGDGFYYDAYSKIFFIDGDLRVTGNITGYYSSDRNLKNNIIPISNSLSKVRRIGGYEYDWDEEKQTSLKGHDVGVIAQEVKEVLPEVVTERKDGYLAVNYDKIIPLLIESIKELADKVDILEEKLKQYE